MTDARIRILPPLIVAALIWPRPAAQRRLHPYPIHCPPKRSSMTRPRLEVAFPDEEEAPAAPPEELEAEAPAVAPLTPAVAYGDVARARPQQSRAAAGQQRARGPRDRVAAAQSRLRRAGLRTRRSAACTMS